MNIYFINQNKKISWGENMLTEYKNYDIINYTLY